MRTITINENGLTDDKIDNPRREFFNRELREVLNAYKQEKSNEQ